ncbi:MAG TPA: hypothetical protein VFS39_02045 [Nitrospira sp.]|nr:hypothetical protein [Nitrospira sp.]
MSNLVIEEELAELQTLSRPVPPRSIIRSIIYWAAAIVVAFGLGTWLVWWAAYLQRQFVLEEIRGACQRVMPETLDRCVDTVIIQRGGVRR